MTKPGVLARELVVLLTASLAALSCNSSNGNNGKGGSGGAAGGHAGGGGSGLAGASGGGGHAGGGGSAGGGGAGVAGAAGGAGAAGSGGIGGHAGGGGNGGVGGQSRVDGGVDAKVFDGGADCVAPVGEAALDATTAGFPASGLVLWLRGDHGIYTTAGNAVCGWEDQSGHGTIFTPYGARPSWSATAIAGLPAIHSTPAGEGLSVGGLLGIAPTSARTIVAVTQLVSATNRFQSVYQGQSGSAGTYLGVDTNTFDTAGSREGVYMMNNAYDTTTATTTTAPRIHVYTISTMTVGTPVLSGIDYRVDGVTQTLTRTPGGLGNGNFEDFSSANYTSVCTNSEGLVAEVLIYNRALTVAERGTVEAALKTRYGVAAGDGSL
jgi:hypothetical protein